MNKLYIPEGYASKMDLYRTQKAISFIKQTFQTRLAEGLRLKRVSAPLFVTEASGLNDNLNGTERPVSFDVPAVGESAEVVHAIEAHHNDVEPQTVEAVLVQAADAISAARPGARRESLENYIKRLTKLEEISMSFAGVEKCYAIQSGREVRIMVKPDDVTDEGTKVLAKEIAKRIEKEMEYPGQIRVNVIRETRSMEYAK